MASAEEARHQLYLRLEAVLGSEEATTFMEHMPPVGWADVATKHDLEQQSLLTKRDIELASSELRREFGDLRAELQRELRMQTFALLGVGSVLFGVFSALSGSLG